jgi:outer membrane protein OmpA-like peptidoglycan-associated protein
MRAISTILFLIPSLAFAQADEGAALAEADKNFDREQYHLAIEFYLKVQARDAGVSFRLAECYRRTFNYVEAEKNYLQSLGNDPNQAMSLYYYALMLKMNSRYSESIENFNFFSEKYLDHPALQEYIEQARVDQAGCEVALQEQAANASLYSLIAESFNSVYNDYAPVWLDSNSIVVTSGRISSSRDIIDERYGEAFTDNYMFVRTDGAWENITHRQIRNLNSKFNDGSGSYNRKSRKYYFTVCGKESTECRIFLSHFKDGKWGDPVPLTDNINARKSDSKHPAISPGGDTLLFASNRPGGHGQFDIWMSISSGNDSWGPAINLGNSVNTRFNDLAPSFSDFNHIFFFASDGHQGFGGTDLYMAKRFSNGASAIYNLGLPFNSNRDECFVSLSGKNISISSNRQGKGGFDIYTSPITSPLSFVSKISLKNRSARNDVGLLMAGRESTWMDIYASQNEDRIEYENLPNEKKRIVDRMIRNKSTGISIERYEYNELSAAEYELLRRIAQVEITEIDLRRKFNGRLLAAIRPPHDSRSFGFHGVIADSASGRVLAGVSVVLINSCGEVIKTTTTNDSGTFRFSNIESRERLFIRYDWQHDRAIRPVAKDLLILKEQDTSFAFDNVYFDTDRFDLRKDAKDVLSRLAEFLLRLPEVQVEIFAFADDRGKDEYNLTLSEKRGQTVRAFLGHLGVDPTSIAVVAKGRQFDANNSNLEKHRQFNRRVEFYVNGASSESLAANDNKGTP